MHNSGALEVQKPPLLKETPAPHSVHADRIQERGHEEGEEEVACQALSLLDHAGDNGRLSGLKGELEEPERVVIWLLHENVSRGNYFPFCLFRLISESKAKTEKPPRDTSENNISNVFDHHVHDLHSSYDTRLEHLEPRLHLENTETTDHQPHHIYSVKRPLFRAA